MMLTYLFNIVDKKLQKKISKILECRLKSIFDIEVYMLGISRNIIESTEEFEIKLSEFIDKSIIEEKQNLKKGITIVKAYSLKNMILDIVSLIMDNKIKCKYLFEKFKDDYRIIDLATNDNFNYDDFDEDWFLYLPLKFKDELSNNEDIRRKLCIKLKNAIKNNKDNKEVYEKLVSELVEYYI